MTYTVECVFIDDKKVMSRLAALGIIKSSKIKIINKKQSGTMVVDVRGTRLAIGNGISKKIEVKN